MNPELKTNLIWRPIWFGDKNHTFSAPLLGIYKTSHFVLSTRGARCWGVCIFPAFLEHHENLLIQDPSRPKEKCLEPFGPQADFGRAGGDKAEAGGGLRVGHTKKVDRCGGAWAARASASKWAARCPHQLGVQLWWGRHRPAQNLLMRWCMASFFVLFLSFRFHIFKFQKFNWVWQFNLIQNQLNQTEQFSKFLEFWRFEIWNNVDCKSNLPSLMCPHDVPSRCALICFPHQHCQRFTSLGIPNLRSRCDDVMNNALNRWLCSSRKKKKIPSGLKLMQIPRSERWNRQHTQTLSAQAISSEA